jgi:NTP pyrophosphatase (non-canonical NTP hydrolase)
VREQEGGSVSDVAKRDWLEEEEADRIGGSGEEPIGIRNWVSPASTERLAILAEEMGEALQIIGKILRHGWYATHPDEPATPNNELLEREMGDVMAAVRLHTLSGDLNPGQIFHHTKTKLRKFKLGGADLRRQPADLLAGIELGPEKTEYIPTGDRSSVEKLYHQPAGFEGEGSIIAEVHRFFWKTGSRAIEIDSRRLKMEFAGLIGGKWTETRYERKAPGEPFERI